MPRIARVENGLGTGRCLSPLAQAGLVGRRQGLDLFEQAFGARKGGQLPEEPRLELRVEAVGENPTCSSESHKLGSGR